MKNNTLSTLMELCKRECLEGETSYMRVGQARQDCDAATERKLGSQRIKLAGKGEEENGVLGVRLFNHILLSTYNVPDIVLGAGVTVVNNREKVPALLELIF